MLSAFPDTSLEIFVQIPSDWLAHRANNKSATAGDRVEFKRLQKAEPLDRHFDERVVQTLCRGLFKPLVKILSKSFWHLTTLTQGIQTGQHQRAVSFMREAEGKSRQLSQEIVGLFGFPFGKTGSIKVATS